MKRAVLFCLVVSANALPEAHLRGRGKDHLRDRDLSVPEDLENHYVTADASPDELTATNLEEGGFGFALRRLLGLASNEKPSEETAGGRGAVLAASIKGSHEDASKDTKSKAESVRYGGGARPVLETKDEVSQHKTQGADAELAELAVEDAPQTITSEAAAFDTEDIERVAGEGEALSDSTARNAAAEMIKSRLATQTTRPVVEQGFAGPRRRLSDVNCGSHSASTCNGVCTWNDGTCVDGWATCEPGQIEEWNDRDDICDDLFGDCCWSAEYEKPKCKDDRYFVRPGGSTTVAGCPDWAVYQCSKPTCTDCSAGEKSVKDTDTWKLYSNTKAGSGAVDLQDLTDKWYTLDECKRKCDANSKCGCIEMNQMIMYNFVFRREGGHCHLKGKCNPRNFAYGHLGPAVYVREPHHHCAHCEGGRFSNGDGICRACAAGEQSTDNKSCEPCPVGKISTLACTMKVDGPVVASRGNQLVSRFGESLRNYELTFTMELKNEWRITGKFQSILHIGNSDYQRLPGIWFHESQNALYVMQSYNCEWGSPWGNNFCEWGLTTTGVAFEKSKTYEVKVVVENDQMAVYVDGVNHGTASGSTPYVPEDASVYVGNPWHDAAAVTLSNICLRPAEAAGPVCQTCKAGQESNPERTQCVACDPGRVSSAGGMCTDCAAGETSNSEHTACGDCPEGQISSTGQACRNCAAGEESNDAHTACVVCDPGEISSAGGMCTPCAAGAVSNSAHTACDTCGRGKYSTRGTSECEKCGKPDAWNPKHWDPTQRGAASKDECKCARGFTGTDCDRTNCEASPVISLGFLLLEAQWPRHARTLSRNEAFSGISGAFRSFDENNDDYLSIEEARRAIRDGGMAVPLEVTHIWSQDGVVKLNEDDVTITEMISDELVRLKTQDTKEYYDQPSGSGGIPAMEATYPNNHDGDKWSNEKCEDHNEQPPLLEWTVDRKEQIIFQQCAYFNGIALDATTGLEDTISSGGDCNEDPSKCSYEFQLPPDNIYKVTSYKPSGDCTEPGTFTYEGRTLRCIELPSGELVDVLEVENAPTCTRRHTDTDSCPVGYDIWAPRSYEHAKAVVDAVDPKFTHLVGVYREQNSCGGCTDVAMNSEAYDEWVAEGTNRVPWTSVAGSPWFLRKTAFSQPDGNYDAGCWLTMAHGWDDGVGFHFDDNGCGNCFTDYLCSRNGGAEVLDISKHSYCVETKFCPVGTTDCTSSTVDSSLAVMRCTTGLQYNGSPMDLHPRALGRLGVEIEWLYTSSTAKAYRVYKFDPAVAFATDPSARLLREVVLSTAECGLRFEPLDFRDTTTGSQPGINVGYAVVPVDLPDLESPETEDNALTERKDKAGVSTFVVTWWGDVVIDVAAEGGGPVREALVKISHLVDGEIDSKYTDFVQKKTDAYGQARLLVRVQDPSPSWSGLTQHFRVTVEKSSTRANGRQLVHVFEPSYVDMEVRHLLEATSGFTDVTSRVISGTVSHDGFGAAYFADDCPHTKGSGECMCPVDGAKMFIIRASGAEQEVTVNDGKFAMAVFEGEIVTIGLKTYNGTDGVVPHRFTVAYDTQNACTEPGTVPNFQGSGRTLRCIELPSGELVDVLEVENAPTCTRRHTDKHYCPTGYDIWVPKSYEHAKAVVDAVHPKFTHLVGVYREAPCAMYLPGPIDASQNSAPVATVDSLRN